MSSSKTAFLAANEILTITSDAFTTGTVTNTGNPGVANGSPTAIAVSTTTTFGPFNEGRTYRVVSTNGTLVSSFASAPAYDQETVDINGGTLDDVTVSDATISDATLDGMIISDNPVTTAGIGAKNGATVSVVEEGNGLVHKTILTLTATPLEVISVTTGNGVGGIKIYDLPAGFIKILGSTSDLSLGVATEDDYTDNAPEGDISIGTLAPANADALGTDATDDNIGTATAWTMTAFVDSSINVPPEADLLLDGTSTAADILVNALVDASDIDDGTTTDLEVTGTVTVYWINLGDFA